MLVLFFAFGATHEHEPVARQTLAPATATATDCNTTRPKPSDTGRRCVIARFPKTAGTMVTHLMKVQSHVLSRREFGQLRPSDLSADAYIIGQTRHPLDWYSSLWAYLSDAGAADVAPYHIFPQGAPPYIEETLSRVIPRGSTVDDVLRFRAFVRLYTTPQLGAFSLHFWVNYVDLGSSYSFPCQVPGPEDPDCGMRLKSTPQDLQTRLKDPKLLERAAEDVRAFVQRERHPVDAGPESDTESESRRRIACWVRQEDLLNSLHGCLGKCERALDAKLIEWECLDTSQASPALVINPSSPRAANAVLYDEATTQLVSERDGELLAFFGYNATDTAEADRWRAQAGANLMVRMAMQFGIGDLANP
jgi:hypothetical protein